MDGLNTADANQRSGLIVIGATNRPQDIDSAVVRRLSRRILVDLPAVQQRKGVTLARPTICARVLIQQTAIITHYLKGEEYDKKTVNITKLASRTMLFSGSDLRHLVHSAALASLRDILPSSCSIQYDSDGAPIPEPSCTALMPRIIQGKHFDQALKQVAASSASNRKELDELRRWASELFQSHYST
jgi:SpoVK/Ycf46/Vps4 family AAA+-type ATPase